MTPETREWAKANRNAAMGFLGLLWTVVSGLNFTVVTQYFEQQCRNQNGYGADCSSAGDGPTMLIFLGGSVAALVCVAILMAADSDA